MVSTHSLGFLLVPVAPEVPGDPYFPWVLVFQLTRQHLEHLEGPRYHITAVRIEISLNTVV